MIQKAVLVRWMAFAFMAAPLMNLVVVFFASSAETAQVSGALIGPLRLLELIEQAFIFLAGICLLQQHKTRWLVAVVLIFSTVGLNLLILLDSPESEFLRSAAHVRLYFSIFLAFCVVLILYYARYPYLDRRQGWMGPVAKRYDLTVPARVFADEVWTGASESMSASGCRVRLDKDWGPKDRVRFIDVQFPGFSEGRIKAQVVGSQGAILRLKFRDFRNEDRKAFAAWIKGLVEKAST